MSEFRPKAESRIPKNEQELFFVLHMTMQSRRVARELSDSRCSHDLSLTQTSDIRLQP
jgi:hypothetical protein